MAVGTLYTGTEVKYGMAEAATYGPAIADGEEHYEDQEQTDCPDIDQRML